MDCPQWTVMSQLPASILTTLPPKCHPTWGTAAPRRPMWPAPHGSRPPVAVLSLPTAVTLPPHWPSRAWLPRETLSIPSPPPLSDFKECGRGVKDRKRKSGKEREIGWHTAAQTFPERLSLDGLMLCLYYIYERLVRWAMYCFKNVHVLLLQISISHKESKSQNMQGPICPIRTKDLLVIKTSSGAW